MSVTPLITVTEADIFNVSSPDWLSLSNTEKELHIFSASVYMQQQWVCTDVVWSDPSSLDDDLKRACSYYADADRIGVLYSEVSKQEKHRALVEETKKLDGMRKTLRWASSGALTSGNPLESIDAIMGLYCTVSSRTLLRV